MTTTMEAPAITADRPDHSGLFVALLAFQQEMPTVPKSKTARVPTKSGGQYTYSYADLAVLSSYATPLLAHHGLLFITTPRTGAHGYELAGRLIHPTTYSESGGDQIEGSLPLFGTSSQDIGGSITYMRRYLMGCLTGIITDEDTDAVEAPATRAQQQDPRKPAPDKLTPGQIDDLRDWARSNVDVDAVVFRLFGLRGNLADIMTKEQGDITLETLRKQEA